MPLLLITKGDKSDGSHWSYLDRYSGGSDSCDLKSCQAVGPNNTLTTQAINSKVHSSWAKLSHEAAITHSIVYYNMVIETARFKDGYLYITASL